jgi:hypothetical protein
VRRPGRSAVGPARVFAAYTRGPRPWVETATLDDVRALLDVPLGGLADGSSPGLVPHQRPLFLVCTHGRHDACCAERGRPLCTALAQAAPEETWEVSHIGGDRFAGNVLVLPFGLYYGRLEPADVGRFAAGHLSGQLDLDHLRGRSALPLPVQAAEVHLRRHLGERRAGPLPVERRQRDGAETEVVLVVDGARWRVRVRTGTAPARFLTCRSRAEAAPPVHSVVELRRLP